MSGSDFESSFHSGSESGSDFLDSEASESDGDGEETGSSEQMESESEAETNPPRNRQRREIAAIEQGGFSEDEFEGSSPAPRRPPPRRIQRQVSSSSSDSDSEDDILAQKTKKRKRVQAIRSSSEEEGSQSDNTETKGEKEKPASPSSSEPCTICLLDFTADSDVGTPNGCEHKFCADCIIEWSSNVNTCPIDRTTIKSITIRTGTGDFVRNHRVKVRKPDAVENPEAEVPLFDFETLCETCGAGDREECLLLCDGCDLAFHTECLVPALHSIPRGRWYCSTCTGAGLVSGSQGRGSRTNRVEPPAEVDEGAVRGAAERQRTGRRPPRRRHERSSRHRDYDSDERPTEEEDDEDDLDGFIVREGEGSESEASDVSIDFEDRDRRRNRARSEQDSFLVGQTDSQDDSFMPPASPSDSFYSDDEIACSRTLISRRREAALLREIREQAMVVKKKKRKTTFRKRQSVKRKATTSTSSTGSPVKKRRKTTTKKRRKTTKRKSPKKGKGKGKGKGKSSKRSTKDEDGDKKKKELKPSLSLFGNRNDLDYYGDDSLFESSLATTSSTPMSHSAAVGILKKSPSKTKREPSGEEGSSGQPVDFLSNLMSSQNSTFKRTSSSGSATATIAERHHEVYKKAADSKEGEDKKRVISTSTSKRSLEESLRIQKEKDAKRSKSVQLSGKDSGFVYFDIDQKKDDAARQPKHSQARKRRDREDEERGNSETKRQAITSPVFKTKKVDDMQPCCSKSLAPPVSKSPRPCSSKSLTTPSKSSSSKSKATSTSPAASRTNVTIVAHICAAVKVPLKRYYSRGDIDKDRYKEILQKSVKKIMSNGGDIDEDKVRRLVRKYVDRT